MSDFNFKKTMVLNYIELGMEKDRAYILVRLTAQEMEELDNQLDFQQEIELVEIRKEQELLEKLKAAQEAAASKGNTKPIEWMLERLNPDRWGLKKEAPIQFPSKLIISKDDEACL